MNGRSTRRRGHSGNWRTDSDRVRYLSEAEERRLLLALPPHVRDFITVAMDSGGRKGELEALTWDKIDWGEERATLLLPASDTKGGKARRIPVTKRSTDIPRRLRKDHPDAAWVFMYQRAGEIRNLGNVRKPFETACKRAGITDFRIHDCRGTTSLPGLPSVVPRCKRSRN